MRTPTHAQVINAALDRLARELRVALPAKIEAFDPETQLARVKPLLKETTEDEEGDEVIERLPVISDVPVQFPGGNGFVITFPIAAGDPCWLVFADRSLDRWIESGGDVDPVDLRRHHISDPVALLGVRTKAGALAEFDPDAAVLGKIGGPRIRFKATTIHLGVGHAEDATQAVALGTNLASYLSSLKTWLDALILPTAVGPAGPPAIPSPAVPDVTSSTVMVKE